MPIGFQFTDEELRKFNRLILEAIWPPLLETPAASLSHGVALAIALAEHDADPRPGLPPLALLRRPKRCRPMMAPMPIGEAVVPCDCAVLVPLSAGCSAAEALLCVVHLSLRERLVEDWLRVRGLVGRCGRCGRVYYA